jgi:hypothetical protein
MAYPQSHEDVRNPRRTKSEKLRVQRHVQTKLRDRQECRDI